MKILHFGNLNINSGGPAMSTYNTILGLNMLGVQAELLMYEIPFHQHIIGDKISTYFTEMPWEKKFSYAPNLLKTLKHLGEYDVYHAQGVWQYPTYAIASFARKNKKPYLISPRGMLYPQDIAKSSTLFKKWSLRLRLLNDLNEAACVHATCEEELVHLRNLGVTAPIAVIPNPIEIQSFEEKKEDDVFRLGYLGRLSPRKNVESLLYAWHEIHQQIPTGELLIIGGGNKKYEDFLKSEVKRLKLKNVIFTGFVSGKRKNMAIASLSVLALPSDFENFGNVILEGLLRGIPCIATKGSPWKELEEYKCGWWIDPSQNAITQVLKDAIVLSKEELESMGKRGRSLVEEKYGIPVVASQMKTLYSWILGQENPPEFVHL